jgi:abortive infection bacteriophage resistance protein
VPSYTKPHRANLDGQFIRSNGRNPSRYDEWLAKLLSAQARSSEEFIVHFQQKYGGRLPVWVVTEIMDFGTTAHLYRGLKAADRNAIARELDIVDRVGLGNGHTLGNWLLNVEIPACGRNISGMGFPAGWAAQRPWTS